MMMLFILYMIVSLLWTAYWLRVAINYDGPADGTNLGFYIYAVLPYIWPLLVAYTLIKKVLK